MPTNPVSDAPQKQPAQLPFQVVAKSSVHRPTMEALQTITPVPEAELAHEIVRICRDELGCPDVVLVPLAPPEDASVRSLDNVDVWTARNGGEPVFGWRITASPLFVRAVFHAVAMDESGLGLLVVTPDECAQPFSWFAIDRMVPARFDFLERPGPCRYSIYKPAERKDRIAARIATMDPSTRAATQLRATESDLAFTDLVQLEIGEDRLESALGPYLESSDAFELLRMRAIDGVIHTDFASFDRLLRRKLALEAIVVAAFDCRAIE